MNQAFLTYDSREGTYRNKVSLEQRERAHYGRLFEKSVGYATQSKIVLVTFYSQQQDRK